MKKCNVCGITQNIKAFRQDGNYTDKTCKFCRQKKAKEDRVKRGGSATGRPTPVIDDECYSMFIKLIGGNNHAS